jgi:hypothetical protein
MLSVPSFPMPPSVALATVSPKRLTVWPESTYKIEKLDEALPDPGATPATGQSGKPYSIRSRLNLPFAGLRRSRKPATPRARAV